MKPCITFVNSSTAAQVQSLRRSTTSWPATLLWAYSPPEVDRILGLYWDYGKENGNDYLGFRVSVFGASNGHVGGK